MKKQTPKPTQDLLDVDFILSEVLRFSKFSIDEWKSLMAEPSMEGFCRLETQGRPFICGRLAWQRFSDISERLRLPHSELLRKVDDEKLVCIIRGEFTKTFLEEFVPLSERVVSRMLSRVVKTVEGGYEELTHYIPCSIFSGKTVNEFSLGPVEFQKYEVFLEQNQQAFVDDKTRLTEDYLQRNQKAIESGYSVDQCSRADAEKWSEELFQGVEKRFSDYSWIATLKIEHCSSVVSENKAIEVVGTALNLLKLFFGEAHPGRLVTANDPRQVSLSASLAKTSKGHFKVGLKSSSEDNHLGEVDWVQLFETSMKVPYESGSLILDHLAGFSEPPPLVERFVDSLHWYGDAVTEKNISAKILKYVTALERITGTGKEKLHIKKECGCDAYRSVTDIVAKRSALLYCHHTKADFDETVARLKKIYGVRSDLTHGSLSPKHKKCMHAVAEIRELSQVVLMNGLCYFTFIGLESAEGTDAHLKKYFDDFERKVEQGDFCFEDDSESCIIGVDNK